MYCLLKQEPRSVAVVAESLALVFRGVQDNKCAIEMVSSAEIENNAQYKCVLGAKGSEIVSGILGMVYLGNRVFLILVHESKRVIQIKQSSPIFALNNVTSICIDNSMWDYILNDGLIESDIMDTPDYDWSDTPQNVSLQQFSEHPCAHMQKFLVNGSFYYSQYFDITKRLQCRTECNQTFMHKSDVYSARFIWNNFLLVPIVAFIDSLQDAARKQFETSKFFCWVIRGYAETLPVIVSHQRMELSIISRLSRQRTGTRFHSRGIDENGNVSNFVETEVILQSDSFLLGYCLLRGSVPIFWDQEGLQLLGQKIEVTRGIDATRESFLQHFERLTATYGQVEILNLLGSSSGEKSLSTMYSNLLQFERDKLSNVSMTCFDFHAESKSLIHSKVRTLIFDKISEQSYYLIESNQKVIQTQRGIFRVNCLDCLDRTNVVQSLISENCLLQYMHKNNFYVGESFWEAHSHLWANNGDILSKMYAGTGALNSSYTRSGSFTISGLINDISKSFGRAYINNFQDKRKQIFLETFLGDIYSQKPVVYFDSVLDAIETELSKQRPKWTSEEKINLWTGTFNICGKIPSMVNLLKPWIFDTKSTNSFDLYVFGIQEVVELSAGSVLGGDFETKYFIEKMVLEVLNSNRKEYKYIHLRSVQLVGMLIIAYICEDKFKICRNIEGSSKKTGFKGTSGNKGAVAIRFDIGETSFCFVNAHLAAGLSSVEERNRDFFAIESELRFRRERYIHDNDNVFWLGDLNYRLDIDYNKACSLVNAGEYMNLLIYDQLLHQMQGGQAFSNYREAVITFQPTYKFDIGTRNYDTSEKKRIPAWTDRILSRGNNIQQISYDCSQEVLISDHLPVFATFQVGIQTVIRKKLQKLKQELFERHGRTLEDFGDKNLQFEHQETQVLIDLESDTASRQPTGSYLAKQATKGLVQNMSSVLPSVPPSRRKNQRRASNPKNRDQKAPPLPERNKPANKVASKSSNQLLKLCSTNQSILVDDSIDTKRPTTESVPFKALVDSVTVSARINSQVETRPKTSSQSVNRGSSVRDIISRFESQNID